jgi:hypothetical protein
MNSLEAHTLAEERVKLANEYARMSEELANILTVKAVKWAIFRADPECKSDKLADRKWDATPEGLQEMRLRLKMKAWEKQLSSMGSMLRVMETEYKNSNI